MKVLLYFLEFISIFAWVYFVMQKIGQKKIYINLKASIANKKQTYFDSNKKKKSIREKLYYLIQSSCENNKMFWWLIPETLILLCVLIFGVSYILLLPILKLKLLAIILAVSIGTIPIIFLIFMQDINENKIEKNIISYIIQLKNQAKITDDIVEIFKSTYKYAPKPFDKYIQSFISRINSGVNIIDAFENLKKTVNVSRFKTLVSNMESCYLNGGNIYVMLDKTQLVFSKIQEERMKRSEQTLSARLALLVLIAISLFVYFRFVNSNEENFGIMTGDFLGRLILYFDFFSMWIMVFLLVYVKKVDE